MVCTSFALRDDANTGPAGYVCLESVMEGELPGVDCCVGRETDLLAATPFVLVPAFFAAYVGWPSFLAVNSPVAAARGLAATMVYAALSGGYVTLAAMLFWAALSDGYGGDACCDGYSLEFFERRRLPELAMPLSWIAATEGGLALALPEVWPRCCDADTGGAWGEHSAPDVVRYGAVHAVSKLQPGE